ncbi:MAG TPA: hypothetical protein VEX15_01900 [Nocardioidaceae bacterium]|nr:hypothetical protein [Nocardioidaceae bacterium]
MHDPAVEIETSSFDRRRCVKERQSLLELADCGDIVSGPHQEHCALSVNQSRRARRNAINRKRLIAQSETVGQAPALELGVSQAHQDSRREVTVGTAGQRLPQKRRCAPVPTGSTLVDGSSMELRGSQHIGIMA